MDNCILDCQIVRVDREGNSASAQELLGRGDGSESHLGEECSYKAMVFDILEKNGKSLIHARYYHRIKEIPSFSSSKILANVEPRIFNLPH